MDGSSSETDNKLTMKLLILFIGLTTLGGAYLINSIYPFGSEYLYLYSLVVLYGILIIFAFIKLPKDLSKYIIILLLIIIGQHTIRYQYKSEQLANFTTISKWKSEPELQVYRLFDLLQENLYLEKSQEEIQEIMGVPNKTEYQDGETAYSYIYEGIWGWNKWTTVVRIYFGEDNIAYNHRYGIIDAVENPNDLRRPQYEN
ncbi:hypothetical protein [Bacillus suaedae]|uniref:Uncharacterized protein n=1 Tax=Halalkalibacter suaedae TaxID=2822140 RepID=A0A940WUK4_9BACI|nr:hypothetical protein [Bacillus suaedae]MBP3950912.1 hypothetical protein [Bacillus suaedae]